MRENQRPPRWRGVVENAEEIPHPDRRGERLASDSQNPPPREFRPGLNEEAGALAEQVVCQEPGAGMANGRPGESCASSLRVRSLGVRNDPGRNGGRTKDFLLKDDTAKSSVDAHADRGRPAPDPDATTSRDPVL